MAYGRIKLWVINEVMKLVTFNNFLNSFYLSAEESNVRPTRDEVLESLIMVYSGETPELAAATENTARQTVQGLKKLGAGLVAVLHRCKDSTESGTLDLSRCTLLQLPDGVMYMMKNHKIINCILSNNLLSTIQDDFGMYFSNLQMLDLSFNSLSIIPRKILHCKQLKSINISHNSFVAFPSILLELESMTEINVESNFIADVGEEGLGSHERLQLVNLEGNPVSQRSRERLGRVTRVRILLSEQKLEDWEDLEI